MKTLLLERKVKIKVGSRIMDHGQMRDAFEAEMTISEAIKAGYLYEPTVALQIFEQIQNG